LQSPNQSEEIDLGQLFKLIGNAFDRFFKFIASIFIGIYSIVLKLLIHIYKRILWYGGALILGLVIGYIVDSNTDKRYGANMYIETNFKSVRQVYENIKQLHQLAYEDKDSLKLAQELGITISEASKLKGFYIEPDIDENYVLELYSKYYAGLDSLSRSTIKFSDYKESLNVYNFKIHKIGIESTDKSIYKKFESSFVQQISNNPYLDKLLEVNKFNLQQKDEALVRQIEKTDSLVKEYLKIRINESQKELIPGGGTNLYMGDAESSNLIVDESKIIEKTLQLEAQRRQVNVEKVENNKIVNVLADFPKTGYDIREWYDKMVYVFPIILFGMTLIVFTGLGLGKYLEAESNK
jgi:hypothetical protein